MEYTFDVLNRLRTITRGGVVETLRYGPTGELMAKQVGNTWTFWVGDYATVTATISSGVATARKLDAHVIFAGTRIASLGTPAGATAARTLYYYRSRLGSVVATSLGGGVVGAKYRYTPYGAIDAGATTGDNPVSDASKRSELGYTNALRLSGNLLHLKTRAYDPELRVFLQVDSVDRLRYAYTRGDPANYSDPTGMRPIADGGPFVSMLEMSWWGLPLLPWNTFDGVVGDGWRQASSTVYQRGQAIEVSRGGRNGPATAGTLRAGEANKALSILIARAAVITSARNQLRATPIGLAMEELLEEKWAVIPGHGFLPEDPAEPASIAIPFDPVGRLDPDIGSEGLILLDTEVRTNFWGQVRNLNIDLGLDYEDARDRELIVAVRLAHEYCHALLAQAGQSIRGPVRAEDAVFHGLMRQLIGQLRANAGSRP